MDLKDFIKETVNSLVQASVELTDELSEHSVIVNPPITDAARDEFDPETVVNPIRGVTLVEFDVAVSATSETGGGGRAGLKILSAEIGGEAKHIASSEQVSRIKFQVPVTMPPTKAEAEQNQRSKKTLEEQNRRIAGKRGRSGII